MANPTVTATSTLGGMIGLVAFYALVVITALTLALRRRWLVIVCAGMLLDAVWYRESGFYHALRALFGRYIYGDGLTHEFEAGAKAMYAYADDTSYIVVGCAVLLACLVVGREWLNKRE